MFIFLDESGDLGFNFNLRKTSKFFIITLLVCENRESLYLVRTAIKKTLKRKLNYKAKRFKHEIKGNDTNFSVKEFFYKKLANCDAIKIHSIVLNKKRLLTKIEQVNSHRIYTRMSHDVLKSVDIHRDSSFVQIIADRCKYGVEAEEFSKTLQLHLVALLPLTSKITIEQIPSVKDYGLQAVDLFSFGIYRKHEFNDLEWYRLFEDKISTELLI